MFKMIARAVLPFIAAVTVAQADTTTGRITYVNYASHMVAVDSVPVQLAASVKLSGFNVGQLVHVARPSNGAGAQIAAFAPIVEQKATGRVTFIGDDKVIIDNVAMQIPAGFDTSTLRIGNRAEVEFTSVAGLNFAASVTSQPAQVASAQGRITYANPEARMVLVDSSTWIKLPSFADAEQYRIGSYLTASYTSNNGINVAMTLASL